MEPHRHPVYARLTNNREAFGRHMVLHELEQRLHEIRSTDPLVRKVRHFVERGVPYFAPADQHYREWAAQAASYWASIDALTGHAPDTAGH